jgi:hypothetical protein
MSSIWWNEKARYYFSRANTLFISVAEDVVIRIDLAGAAYRVGAPRHFETMLRSPPIRTRSPKSGRPRYGFLPLPTPSPPAPAGKPAGRQRSAATRGGRDIEPIASFWAGVDIIRWLREEGL